MLKGVTKRQIIVLYVLVAFLIVVLGVRYAVLPMMEANDDRNAKLSAKISEYDNLVFESRQVQVYEELNKQLEQEIKNVSKSFQSNIKTSNIDAVISSIIKESGLQAVSLMVSEPVDVTDTSLKSGETQAPNQAQQTNDEKDKDKSGSESTVKSITANVTTSGSYAELVKFIGLVSKQEAMYMKDLTFTMKVDEKNGNDDITMNFAVVSFVYTPQEEARAAEEVSKAAS